MRLRRTAAMISIVTNVPANRTEDWMATAVRTAELRPSQAGFTDERLRLTRDIHDVVGSAMTAIQLQAQFALRILERRPAEAAEALRTITTSSQRSLAELRTILGGGRGEDEPRIGLAQLDTLVAMTTAGRVHVDIDVAGEIDQLPPAHDETAYRIIQESLTNAIRHGQASSIELKLRVQPGLLLLEVIDNGTAGASPKVTQLPGRGIRGMRERAALLGGTLSAGPNTDSGFSVRARLPLPGETPSGAQHV
jgi:signal transduction histidine kinase